MIKLNIMIWMNLEFCLKLEIKVTYIQQWDKKFSTQFFNDGYLEHSFGNQFQKYCIRQINTEFLSTSGINV